MSQLTFYLKYVLQKIIVPILVFFGQIVKDLGSNVVDKINYFIKALSVIWKFVFTGSTGDLMVQPSLLSLIVYLFFSGGLNQLDPIIDPGDYDVSIVGFDGNSPSNKLISLWSEYQMISPEKALEEILGCKINPLFLAKGIKEIRVNYLKELYKDSGAILNIVRTSITN